MLPSPSDIASMRADLDAHDIASVLGASPPAPPDPPGGVAGVEPGASPYDRARACVAWAEAHQVAFFYVNHDFGRTRLLVLWPDFCAHLGGRELVRLPGQSNVVELVDGGIVIQAYAPRGFDGATAPHPPVPDVAPF